MIYKFTITVIQLIGLPPFLAFPRFPTIQMQLLVTTLERRHKTGSYLMYTIRRYHVLART